MDISPDISKKWFICIIYVLVIILEHERSDIIEKEIETIMYTDINSNTVINYKVENSKT